MATENIKTASQVITEFLDSQAKDESLDMDTVSAVTELRKDNDLSKIKLLRALEEARKDALTAVAADSGQTGHD
ncbi:hypothetical protein [Microbaculum marinisediminis]|uniref:Uncharacterized protein n=1 Tax=Microbaculum marinisediminis TaxID=2931392 RepID=A0AAW5QRS6_9HYPH|nr:hypothetical protein [Microbaculum sp. A6E488]MCT8970791.1 hypothetical protein [Microbaculum sp. A6E488]